jgi:N-acetylglucosaminyl-diphospho-decaprenol L-rhamnosyltransferase
LAPFDDPRVALTGPLARTPDGRIQDQGLPYRLHVARIRWRGQTPRHPPATPWVAAPWLSGCLLVVRRDALARVGGMDGSLRFYNEDLEWGRRCRASGYLCALVATEVIHVGGASTPPQGRFLVEGLRGGYAIARRTAPPLVRLLHRWGVAAFAWGQSRLARDAARRATWLEVLRRFAGHDLDESPFGATLDEPASPAPAGADAIGGAPGHRGP